MANVKVAVRVRPLSARESAGGGRITVQIEDKVVRIKNIKLDGRTDGLGDSREKLMDFGFDYCYWSVDPEAPNYASQEEVFQDLGTSVLAGAAKGYNVCLFAYGQTGSGKTYTMMGTPASVGLTPRICEGLFTRDDVYPEGPNSCRVEVSFLEIYNERVRDLLKRSDQKKPFTLRVREHPEKGPYVQGLSQHVVSDYKQAVELLEEGIANRITAATHIHDASSRSHAIFTIQYTQAILENNMPSEIVSKINLVDLAGSERADPNYCRDRITEGSNINKSLVTLGIVISALAQNSQMFSSCQSINSVVSEGEGSTAGSHSSSHSGGGRRHCYIPYRDSVLTWLLKDSLGGNSKTIMVATISPSSSSYSETLSTLRYAAHARNIVNKPRVNEDASVKLIRELREEINRLKNMLLSFEMRNPSPSFSEYRDGNLSDIVLQNELKIEQLTKDWTDKWRDKQELLEQYCVDINRERARVQIDSLLPHLIAVDGDVLSTGVTFYYLQEGVTKIGPSDELKDYHIVLQGPSADRACCEIVNERGVVTLRPVPGNLCTINHREVTEPCRLAQGAMIVLGGAHKFRFNHPAEAAILRHRRRTSEGFLSSGSGQCLHSETEPLSPVSRAVREGKWELGEGGTGAHSPGSLPTRQLVEQQCYVKSLKEEIQAAQRKAERDLESEQLHLRQQHRDNQQWVLQETQRLTFEERRTRELGVQTDLVQGSGAQAQVPQGWRVWEETQGNRKKLVQEELLRHHALRRAESRVRRKRLRYQLEKIARKRHLLEAKRELQCLESALLLGRESSTSPDLHTGSRGASPILRRHSFSAELLSRLYPHHTPIYSQFLNKNKSSELAPPLGLWKPPVPRRCLSEECLPAAAARRMRDQTQTSTTRVDYQLGSNTNSVENLKELDINLGPCRRDIHPWTAKGHHRKNKRRVDRNPELQQRTPSILDQSKSKERTVSKSSKSKTRRNPSKVVKHSIKGNKGHERIKNAISQSVSPGIKIVLSRVLRKPPSGLSPKSIKKITGRLFVNLDGKAAEKCCIKMSSSCEDLEHLSEPAVDGSHPKRWHSAEVLTEGIKQASGQILSGWDESEEEGSSDSDSLYSLDSLSSAYTRALAEQLKQEDADNAGQSDGESVDSQMSQDSLVTESHRKQSERVAVPSPSQRGAGLLSNSHPAGSYLTNQERRISLDCLAGGEEADIENFSSLGSATSDEMPAEIYWKFSSPRTEVHPEVLKEYVFLQQVQEPKLSVYQQQENKDDIGKDPLTAVESPCLRDYSLSSMSQKSAREEERLLALTDAWSSTETSDSPRVLPNSLVSHDAEDTLNSFPLSSPELSDSLSCTLDLDPSPTSTLGKNTTLEEQRYWDLNTSACMRTVIGRTLKEITHPLIPSSQSNIVLHNEQPASSENGGTQSCSSPVSECGSILKVVENVPFVQGSDIKSSSGTNCPKQNEKNSANEPLGKLPCSSPSMISSKNIIPGSSETVSMHHSERLHPWSQSDQLHLEPAGFSSRGVEVRSVSPSELPCRHVLVDMPSGTIDFPEERTTEKDCTAQDNHAITQPPLVSNAMCEAHTEASIKDVNIGMACLSFSEQQDNKGFPQHRHSDTDNLINISSLQCSNNANSNSNTEASLTTPKNDPNPFPGGSDKRDLMYSASYDSPETSEIPSFSEELNHGVDSTPKSENQVSPHNHPHLCSREMQQSDYPKENEMMGFKGSACGSDAAKTLEQTERIIWEGNSKEQDSSSKDITGPEEHMPHAGMEEVKVKAICKEEDEEVFKETCLDTVVTKESTEKNGANHPEEEPIDTEEHQEACKTNKPKLDSVEKMHKQCRSTYSKSVVESIDQCPSLPVNTPSQADSTVETRKCSHITSEEYSTNLNVFERETNNLNINIGIQNSQLLEEVEGNNSIVISDISKVQNVPYTCKNQHLYHDSKVLTVPVAISHISELVPDSTGNTLTQQSSGGKTHVQELNEEKGRLDSALKCDLEDVACESISASVERRQTLWTLEKTESMKGDSAADDEDRKNVTLKYSQSGPENGISTVDQKISEVVKEHMEVSMKDVSHGRLEEYKLVACMSESDLHKESKVLDKLKPCTLARDSRYSLLDSNVPSDTSYLNASSETNHVRADSDHNHASQQPLLWNCNSHAPTSVSSLDIELTVLKDDYVRVDMANFDLDSKDLSSFPVSSHNQGNIQFKEGKTGIDQKPDKEGNPCQISTSEMGIQSPERLNYVQIGTTENINSAVLQLKAKEENGSTREMGESYDQAAVDSRLKKGKRRHLRTSVAERAGMESQQGDCVKQKPNTSIVEQDFQQGPSNSSDSVKMGRAKIEIPSHDTRTNIAGVQYDIKPVSSDIAGNCTADEQNTIVEVQYASRGAQSLAALENNSEKSRIYSFDVVVGPPDDVYESNYRQPLLGALGDLSLQPEGDYLENISRSPRSDGIPQMRLMSNHHMKGSLTHAGEAWCTAVMKQSSVKASIIAQTGPGAQDYFDIRMSNWTVPFDQIIQPTAKSLPSAFGLLSQSSNIGIWSTAKVEGASAITTQTKADMIQRHSTDDLSIINDPDKNGMENASDVLEGIDGVESPRNVFTKPLGSADIMLLDSERVNLDGAESETMPIKDIFIRESKPYHNGSCQISALNEILSHRTTSEAVAEYHVENALCFSTVSVEKCRNVTEHKDEEQKRTQTEILRSREWCSNDSTLIGTSHNPSAHCIRCEQIPQNEISSSLGNLTHLERRTTKTEPVPNQTNPASNSAENLNSLHNLRKQSNHDIMDALYILRPAVDGKFKGPIHISDVTVQCQSSDHERSSFEELKNALKKTCPVSPCSVQKESPSDALAASQYSPTDRIPISSTLDVRKNVCLLSPGGQGPENNSRVGEDEGSVHGRQSSSIQFNTKGEQISNSKSPAIDRKSEPSPSGPQTNLPKQSYDQMTSEALVTDFATHPAVDACASINTNSTRALSSSHRISLLEDHKSAHECNCSGPRNKDSTDADNTRTPQNNKVGNKHKKRPKPERFDTPASSLESSSSAESILNLSLEQSLTLNRSPDRSAIALPRHRAQNHSKHNKAPHSKKECCTDLQDHRGSSPAVTGSLNALSHVLETSTHQQSSVIPAQSNREINDGSCPQKSSQMEHKPIIKPARIQTLHYTVNSKALSNNKKEFAAVPVTTDSKEEISAVYHSSKDQPSNPYPSHNGMGSFRQDRFQPQGGSSHLPDKKDAMHFGSSDINPYGHPWQQKEASRVVFKNQAFGSASDVSCQTISLEVGDHTVTRCCSVDNGLNIQNSPFPSHLSSFANTRGMSSTLSSIEDYQKQEPLMYQQKGRNLLNSGSCNSFCSVASGELGNSSVQVDEIVLLYSSEPESVMPPCEGPLRLTCEHSTQTLDDSRQTKKTRHRRSSTQIPVSRKEDEEIVGQQSTSWASLQNMSLHLSQLIHNTSDLLGNIQTVRAREAHHQPSTPKIFAPLLNSSRKRDSSTQTTVDVGIQTECFLKSSSRIGHKTYPVEDTKKPQEVNVIVKVIGSDILDVSQEDKDITLTLKDKGKKAAVKIQSMPDLCFGNTGVLHSSMNAAPVCVRASTPSLDTSIQNHSSFSPGVSPVMSPERILEQVDISNLGISRITGNSPQMSPSENQKLPREESAHHTTYRNESYKPVCLIDRASSPILTVEVGIKTCMGRSKSIQCLVNHVESHDSQELLEDSFREQRKTRSASWYGFRDQDHQRVPSEQAVSEEHPQCGSQSSQMKRLTSVRAVGSTLVENISNLSNACTGAGKTSRYTLKLGGFKEEDSSDRTKNLVDECGREIVKADILSPRLLRESTSPLPSNGNVRLHTPPTVTERPGDGPPLASKQVDRAWGRHQQCATPESPSYYRNTLRYYQGTPEEVDNWKSHFETFEASEGTVQLQDDDTVSVAPSECNTEVLLNINPLEDSSQSPQSRQENCSVPEDLPMHNKFTNWSGVHYRPPSSLNSSSAPQTECLDQKTKKKKSGSAASSSPASRELQDNRVREIERLRKERAQVMAGIGLDLNCHQLTVELREAKLNYGLGETDALLKMLHSGAEEDTPSVPTKQQLYDRHKKSIEGLRQERETLLQSCRRARSLSPSKHPSCSGQGAGPLPRDPDTPSRRREYLQQLRQDVIDSTRVVEARRPGARCPSEIELLIRDYGRAREEAKTEIARARDRLRERTEQEKRRLQQQALSQILRVQDDLRFHTRISTSTLCTGSSLSLSSGPTSGYNSSNTVAPTEGTKQPLQLAVGASEESGLKVRGRPTVWCTQGLQAKRQWLSAHDVRLEVPDSGSEAQQPPFSSRVRERTLSVSSALSVSESYQEIAACTVACAVAEIRSAAEGDLANLLAGQASSGWKYQGSEQGVQVYYKPFPSTSVHGFLGAGVIGQPLYSVWCMIRDHSKTHLYHKAIRVTQTRPLDSATQLVYLVMDTSACCLTQPRDFCCISVELKQENLFVLALRSVFDETLPRPDAEMVRGELLPSAWLLQPHSQDGKEVTHATYMTQVDLGTPALPLRLLSTVAKRQAAVIANLDRFFTF
ncbi:stAR-related lipid transfer protein 9 [Amia ocellicauda]|uniref:stAR-related lipid transfer protein 9 n=1 Tax=Amia ocellicauda TaxID=2972642 RepID=UPI003464740A